MTTPHTTPELLACREAFVKKIKAENFDTDIAACRWSLKQNWAGPQHGFADEQLQRRWLDFKAGWNASQTAKAAPAEGVSHAILKNAKAAIRHWNEFGPEFQFDICMDHLQSAIEAAPEAPKPLAPPSGYALVPLEPDDDMQAAGAKAIRFDTSVLNKIWTGNAVFRAMVAASPPPPGGMVPLTDPEEWDFWDVVGLHCAGYNSSIDADLIGIFIESSTEGRWYVDIAKRLGLQEHYVELLKEILCSADFCEYGTSPRGAWAIDATSADNLAKLKAWYLSKWGHEFTPHGIKEGSNGHD